MIPMPERIAKLPTYRGRPVPVTVLSLADGTVDFRVTDTEAWARCIEHSLCGICGEPLDAWVCFLGGSLSSQSLAFTDAPMHEECARYSAQACPYLAGEKAYADFKQIAAKHADTAILVEIPMATSGTLPHVLPHVWLVKTQRVIVRMIPDRGPVLFAQEPVELECLR